MYALLTFRLLALPCVLMVLGLHCSLKDLNSLSVDHTRALGRHWECRVLATKVPSEVLLFLCVGLGYIRNGLCPGFCRVKGCRTPSWFSALG